MPAYPDLSESLPPLILGVGVFNHQFNTDPFHLPTNAIVLKALQYGIRAFDTSPYYGPSEEILGQALATPEVTSQFKREDYFILTKVGRITASEFDYSPGWVRSSVERSLQRLKTTYLDVVYCHDVEFVSREEVLAAIKELRHIRDSTGMIRQIGISGYPVELLCELAELVRQETGEPLDIVQSYAHHTLQNTKLDQQVVQRLKCAGVKIVPNASPLGMGLMRSVGVPIGSMGDFHPSSSELRKACLAAAKVCEAQGERLETVALWYSIQSWLRCGASVGTTGPLPLVKKSNQSGEIDRGSGITVLGCSYVDELDQAASTWRSILLQNGFVISDLETTLAEKDWDQAKIYRVESLAQSVRKAWGSFLGEGWDSPSKDFINTRVHSTQ